MTTRLYYNSDALSFQAVATGHEGDPTRLVLDQTLFYPTSGGQPHDTGTLNETRVLDVIDAGSGIVHVLEKPIPLGPVAGVIDAERRFDFTVQHTSQHLLSALAADRFGWDTTSVHFGSEHSTIEFAVSAVTEGELSALESAANAAIRADHRVTISMESSDAVGLRKMSTREGTLRIVTIEGIDRSACGGTHLSSIGRIGAVWVEGVERIRGQVRVSFRAGPRVLSAVHRLDRTVQQIASSAGASPDEIAELVPRRLAALRAAEARREELESMLATTEILRLVANAQPGADGLRVLLDIDSDRTLEELRCLARAVESSARTLFIGSPHDSSSLVVGASADAGWHAGDRLRSALAPVGGKGGGTATFAQGSVPHVAMREGVVESLQERHET